MPGYVVSWTCQLREGMEPDPGFDELWEEFYNSPDDNYRNERLKILPNIPDGNWIVKKTVGKKPAIAARAVDAQWNRGSNYLEVVYDVSTSYVGNKIFMAGDPFLKLTKAIGAEVDKSEKGLGIRSNRYTMLVENGEVKKVEEEKETATCELSAAENFLKSI